MKTIAKSANDFRDLRTKKEPCVYVDKTAHFHRLITDSSSNLFFIARPRRFGKSLMITTFKYIFQGRRELFEGLDIARTDYDWQVSPVIHIDFGLAARGTYAAFMAQLPDGSREQGERKNEFSYQRPLCMLLAAQGFQYNPEVYVTGGRSDIVAEHPTGIWIFELKVDGTAEAALDQIRKREYLTAYLADGRPIYAIGLSFDSKTRHLADYRAEQLR